MSDRKLLRKIFIWSLSVGGWEIFVYGGDQGNYVFLLTGIVYILLSLGVFLMQNWARILLLIVSIIQIVIYFFLIIGTITGAWQGFGGIGLIFNFPNFALSGYSLYYLTRKHIVILFSKTKSK